MSRSPFRRILAGFGLALLAAAGIAAADIDAEHGVVAVAYDGIPQKVHPVMILEIDGTLQPLPLRDTLFVKPGKHSFRLGAKFDDNAGLQRGNWEKREARRTLEIEVEAGKRYLIGAKLVGRTGSDWEPVVLRVEDRRGRPSP